MRPKRVIFATLRITLLGLFLPGSAMAQGVTVHAGNASETWVADGLDLSVAFHTGSEKAGLRFVVTDDGSVRLRAPDGCEVAFEDRDGDGSLETRRTRWDGRLVARCGREDTGFSPSFAEGSSAIESLDGCRFETQPGGRVLCVDARDGTRREIARGVGADSLGWHGGVLILDDAKGVIYTLVERKAPTQSVGTIAVGAERPKDPELPLRSRLADSKDADISPERKAILDKQREAFPRAFQDEAEETPQAARAFNGHAARAARRNRAREGSND